MERVSNKYHEDYPAATLYIEDVLELVDTFSQACEGIEISAGEYKISNPAELNALASKFTDDKFDYLKIQGYKPYVSLELRAFGARTYISEDSLEQRGVIAKVREVLHRSKKIRPELFANIGIAVMFAIAGWQIQTKAYYVGALALFIAFSLPYVSTRLRMRSTVVVYTKSRAEAKGFFQRKKDDVVLALISAALGAAASYAATKLLP